MPVLSDKLPEYSGEYEVGTIDLEVPCEKRTVSDAVFKNAGGPAFELETVLFSLFYPAVKGQPIVKAPHRWVENVHVQAKGYARLAHIDNVLTNSIFSWALWALVGSTTVPANVDAPLHGSRTSSSETTPEQPRTKDSVSKFPVIVFSHGQASGRTSYTQYCGELASRGYVVAAIEHRDGSGPGTEVKHKDGVKRTVFPMTAKQLEPVPEADEFKMMQRTMRQAELEETVRVLRLINDGKGIELFQANARSEGAHLDQWEGRLDIDRLVFGGHSFGATGALQALRGAPCKERPFVGAVVLDPGKQSGALNEDIDVPVVVVHSQTWSSKFSLFQGRAHFDVVKDVVKRVLEKGPGKKRHAAWFITSKGTSHASVTDAALIEPSIISWATGSAIDAREGVLEYVMVTQNFMRFLEDGKLRGVLAEEVTHPVYNDDIRSEKRKRDMDPKIAKYWQIHVAPG